MCNCRAVALGSLNAQDYGVDCIEKGLRDHLKKMSEPAKASVLVR